MGLGELLQAHRGGEAEFPWTVHVPDARSIYERQSHLRTELVVDALQMAVWRRKPAPGAVHYSDRGVQYTALSFSERLKEVGITPSIGRTGPALDNAMAEGFVSTLKTELVGHLKFPSRQAARTSIFDYLGTFYNTRRLHSAPGYRSPPISKRIE
jgi:putative transposase